MASIPIMGLKTRQYLRPIALFIVAATLLFCMPYFYFLYSTYCCNDGNPPEIFGDLHYYGFEPSPSKPVHEFDINDPKPFRSRARAVLTGQTITATKTLLSAQGFALEDNVASYRAYRFPCGHSWLITWTSKGAMISGIDARYHRTCL